MCVFFEFLVFIADLLLLFSCCCLRLLFLKGELFLFLNLVWELRRGGGDAWIPGNAVAEKKKAWMEMRRMFEEGREFGEKMRN